MPDNAISCFLVQSTVWVFCLLVRFASLVYSLALLYLFIACCALLFIFLIVDINGLVVDHR